MPPPDKPIKGLQTYTDFRTGEQWIQVPVGPWRVEYHLERQGLSVVIGELRIVRNGEHVPPGGLTRRVVRDLPTGKHLRDARRLTRKAARDLASYEVGTGSAEQRRRNAQAFARALGQGLDSYDDVAPRTAARQGKGKDERLFIAAAYAREVAARNTQPVATLARAHGWRAGNVHQWVHRARQDGWLTREGRLTVRARHRLDELRSRRT